MFNRVTLAQRISAGFLLVIVLLAMIVWSGNSALEGNQQALQRVVNSEAEKVRLVGRMGQHLLALQSAENNLILARTQQQMDGYQAAIEQQDRELKEHLARVRQMVDRQGEGLLNQFAEQYDAFRTNQRAVVGLSRQNANVRARVLSQGEGRAAYDNASEAMAKMVELNDRHVGRLQRAVAESVSKLRLSAHLLQDLLVISRAERNMLLASNAVERDEQTLLITQRLLEMQERRTRLRALVDEQGGQILDAFVVEWEQFLALNRQLRGLLQQRASAPGESEAVSADPYALAAVQGRAHSERAEQLLIRLMNKSDQEHGVQLRGLGRASEKIKLAARINRNLTELQRGEKSVILATTEQEMDRYAHALADLRLDLEGRLRELGQLIAAEEALSAATDGSLGMERAAYEGFSRAYQGYLQIHQQVRDTSRLNSNVKALARFNGEGRDSFDRAEATLKQLVRRADAEMDAALQQSESNFIAARNSAYVIAAIALLIALVVALLIVRILSSRTQQLAERAQQIALGDLQGGQRSEVEDELSVIERSLQQIQESFAEVVKIANGIAVGDLQGRLTPRSAQDPLVESINRMADNSAETIRIANVIAAGDLDAEITLLSERDQLGHALQKMVSNLQQSRREMARRNWIVTRMTAAIGSLIPSWC